VVKVTSKTIPESYVAQSSDDNATKYLGLNALKGIELKDISASSVKKWWKAVEPYEKMYGDWNRALIDPTIKDRIDGRWMQAKLWLSCLPAEIQKAYSGTWRPTNFEWMNPKIITTQKLYTWLLNMSYASTGKGVGNMKHEEFISWLKHQRVEFTREDFVNSFEQFEGEFRKQLEILTDTIG
jgi:hypothetical protein